MTENLNNSSSRGGLIKFSFDAKAKPMVGQVLAAEEKRSKGFLARKPKTSLREMEQVLAKSTPAKDLIWYENRLNHFYYNHDSAPTVYEALGRLYLQAAAKENGDPTRQNFLLYRALDALAISIQKSPKSINLSAQGVIVAVHKLLGSGYSPAAMAETAVHQEMGHMINIKKDLNDSTSREKIIKLYLQGERYYEALVQLAEYEKTMQTRNRPLYQQKRGEIAFRKGAVFQMIIDFYQNVQAGKPAGGQVGDMNKLASFITRFNRDNKRYNIIPLAGRSTLALNKTLASMVVIANSFYLEAAKSDRFGFKHKCYYQVARNHYTFENAKAALQTLAMGVREVEMSRLPAKSKVQEKINFLEFQKTILTDTGQMRKAEEVAKEISRLYKAGPATAG